MALEIERKFLVDGAAVRAEILRKRTYPLYISQAYLAPGVRVRAVTPPDYAPGLPEGFLTLKSKVLDGSSFTRKETEIPIPYEVALDIMGMDEELPFIVKERYVLDGFEVDYFSSFDLWVAEREVSFEDDEEFYLLPLWIVREVTDDPYYSSYNLARLSSGNDPSAIPAPKGDSDVD